MAIQYCGTVVPQCRDMSFARVLLLSRLELCFVAQDTEIPKMQNRVMP